MSMLKQIDPASGHVTEAPAPGQAAPAQGAFADAQKAAADALHRMEDAFTVALKAAEGRIAELERQLDALGKAKAEADAKVAVLKELKAKLDEL
jgi:peptidoglycan hydrolase CwlO-like protein